MCPFYTIFLSADDTSLDLNWKFHNYKEIENNVVIRLDLGPFASIQFDSLRVISHSKKKASKRIITGSSNLARVSLAFYMRLFDPTSLNDIDAGHVRLISANECIFKLTVERAYSSTNVLKYGM